MARSAELQVVIDELVAGNEAAAAAGLGPSIEGVREMMEGTLYTAPMPDGITVSAVMANGVPCEWVVDADADTSKRLLYVHGGGYAAGNLNTHRTLAAEISKVGGVAVLNVDYRLAPEHLAPAQFDDSMAAYRWMLENGPDGTGGPTHCFVAGDSAGGGLTLAVLMGIRDAGLASPTAAVAMSPWADMTCSGGTFETRAETDPMIQQGTVEWFADLTCGDSFDMKDPRISPMFGGFQGLPPILIQVSEDETLLDDALVCAEKANAAGVDVTLERWPGTIHVWQALGREVPEAADAIDKIGAYIRSKA